MTTSADPGLATRDRERDASRLRSHVRPDATPAYALLWQAALLGLSGDALIYNGPSGPGLPRPPRNAT